MKQKALKRFPGYVFCEDGTIFSYWTRGVNSRIDMSKKPLKIKQGKSTNGYMQVMLKDSEGIRKAERVHRFICEAFNGECPIKHECSHLNGDRADNRASNLIWETTSDNHKRKILHGTDDCGVRNSRAKIDLITLQAIKKMLNTGEFTHKKIGEMFGLGRVFISKIKGGYRYAR